MTVRTKRININVTAEERELLKRAGHLKYQTLSEYIRYTMLKDAKKTIVKRGSDNNDR